MKKTKTLRAELIDFEFDPSAYDGVVDPGVVTREGVTVCPFGEGLVCTKPGCMVCDDGPRCCTPGETCYLKEQDVTNWCTGFRGADFSGTVWGQTDGLQRNPRARETLTDPKSFWER